jgi:tetratricopeptide (TPR) repeat protein
MVREPLPEPQRKRLEKVFEVATKKAATATTPDDFDYITKLVAQCIVGEPGNAIFVRMYLESLQKKFGNVTKIGSLTQFKERGARAAVKKALSQEQWDEVIAQGLKVLAVNPWDKAALIAMSTAANKSGDRDCELCYLQAALKGSPKDAACNRLYAIALTDRGLIDQAITFWHRVEDVLPNDEEAKRSIASLTVQKQRSSGKFDDDSDDTRLMKQKAQQYEVQTLEQRLLRKIKSEPDEIAPYLELAQNYVNEDRFAEAEKLLEKAYELSNGDIEVREKWEDSQLRNMRQQIGRAKDIETRKKLEGQYFLKNMEFCKGRVERNPANLLLKYELGYLYMKNKMYQDAIRELQTAKNDPRKRGVCMLALGECFVAVKQYRLAMRHFEQAIEDIPDRDAENKRKAYYVAGRLALGLKELEPAEKHLSTLAGLDFNYKDVSKLLDKIAKLRENPESGKTTPPEKKDGQPDGDQNGGQQ